MSFSNFRNESTEVECNFTKDFMKILLHPNEEFAYFITSLKSKIVIAKRLIFDFPAPQKSRPSAGLVNNT